MTNLWKNNKSVLYGFKNDRAIMYPFMEVGIRKVMFSDGHSKKATVLFEILKENDNEFLDYLSIPRSFHLRYYEVGALCNPTGGTLKAVLDHCVLKRNWVLNLSMSKEWDPRTPKHYFEVECDFYWTS